MAEMWDIARYVEDHPEDHEQRWRLAKKLYMAWEYRLALEHLQVLKSEWGPRVNVRRYLAATYYRLGRYEEAATELEGAVKEWPDELGLREQLARVYEIMGRREQAAEVWDKIAELDPHHPIANSAVRRLKEPKQDTPAKELRIGESDSGIDLSVGIVCPNCGAQNSAEFDRCWQCHAQLETSGRASRSQAPAKEEPPQPLLTLERLLMLGTVAAVAFLSIGFFLTLRLYLYGTPNGPLHSFAEVFDRELLTTRAVTGALALFAWPGAIWAALALFKMAENVPPGLVNLAGVFLAALTYVASFVPTAGFIASLLLPSVFSLVIILAFFRLPTAAGLGVWGLQLLFSAVAVLAIFVMCERIQTGIFLNPFTEIPAILRFTQVQQSGTVGMNTAPDQELPIRVDVTWKSTGSAWLDRRSGPVHFRVTTESFGGGLMFELKDLAATRLYEEVRSNPWSGRYWVEAGKAYTIIIDTPRNDAKGTATLAVEGLLPPQFLLR